MVLSDPQGAIINFFFANPVGCTSTTHCTFSGIHLAGVFYRAQSLSEELNWESLGKFDFSAFKKKGVAVSRASRRRKVEEFVLWVPRTIY